MISKDRCKEHYQGDRCHKTRHHDSSVAMNPDDVHQGSFNKWNDRGLLARLVPERPRLSRGQKRTLKRLTTLAPTITDRVERKQASNLLGFFVKFLRGEKI